MFLIILQAMYVSYLGELNMRALQAFALPQMVALLVVSIGGVEVSMTRGMAIRTCGYYATTSVLAVTNGMVLVTTIRPGDLAYRADEETNRTSLEEEEQLKTRRLTVDVVMDMGRNFFPPNVMQASLETFQTRIVPTYDDQGELVPLKKDWTIRQKFHPGTNFLGIISFCVLLGIALQVGGKEMKKVFAAQLF